MNDDSIGESVFSSDILTNATPIGMAPNTDGCLVKDSSILRPELIVSDIIYNPLETKLYKMAKEKGCSVFNGLYMLLYQGAEAFYLWTGRKCLLKKSKQSTLISAIKLTKSFSKKNNRLNESTLPLPSAGSGTKNL